jgi:hypothetical protein
LAIYGYNWIEMAKKMDKVHTDKAVKPTKSLSKFPKSLGFGSHIRAIIEQNGGGFDLELPKRSMPRELNLFEEEDSA